MMPRPYANDPARWLVVYNSSHADSQTWADTYAAARNVPAANLLGLPLSTDEQISVADYNAMRAAIASYLDSSGLAAQLMGVLLGYRVPGLVNVTGGTFVHSISSLLYDLLAPPDLNPIAQDGQPVRPTPDNTAGMLLTARVDGPDLTSALAMISRSTQVQSSELGESDAIFLDPYAAPTPGFESIGASLVSWAGSVDRMRTRLPLRLSAPSDPGAEAQFSSVDGDGFYWAWTLAGTADAPPGLFGTPAGRRAFFFHGDPTAATAPTLRSSTSGWVGPALAAGYAAALGSSAPVTIAALPFARPFFEALRLGWTLAEAWWSATQAPGNELYLIGDPLMTVLMPRAGWDLFGPVPRLEDITPDSPSLALRLAETGTALPPSLQPSAGASGRYVVRRLDDLGRSEAGVTSVRVTNVDGAAVAPPLAPAWPSHDNWPVRIEEGSTRLLAVWERPVSAARVASVALEGEVDGGPAETLLTITPGQGCAIEVDQPLPAVAARYRWRVVGLGGPEHLTPWSATVRPLAMSGATLQIVEP